MKFLICALVVLAATVYVAESQSLVHTLVERGERLIKSAHEELQRLHGAGRGHLTVELEREIQAVEHLVRELRALPEGHQMETHHVHEVEQQLLAHENALVEHLVRIEGHDETADHERHHLLERAEALLHRARADLEHHRSRGHLVQAIEHEVSRIEELVHELRAHPSSRVEASHAKEIEQRLAEHERRLAEELRRLEGN